MEEIKSQLYELDENLDNYLFYDKEGLYNDIMYSSGKEDGLEEGRQKGLEEGRQRGLEEGVQIGTKNIIKTLSKTMSVNEIHKATELPMEKIDEILNDNRGSDHFDKREH